LNNETRRIVIFIFVASFLTALSVSFLHRSVEWPLNVWRVDSDDMWTALASFVGIVWVWIRQRRCEAQVKADHRDLKLDEVQIQNANGTLTELEQAIEVVNEKRALLDAKVHERMEKLEEELRTLKALEGDS
jgi:hypothetical protein